RRSTLPPHANSTWARRTTRGTAASNARPEDAAGAGHVVQRRGSNVIAGAEDSATAAAPAPADPATLKSIEIRSRRIGPGAPVFIVAEIGLNHDGRVERARELIGAAIEAGADCVKFQMRSLD